MRPCLIPSTWSRAFWTPPTRRQRGGADSITLHVRGDRRHMQDADALSVRESVALPLNLEMGNTPEMVDFALRLKPDYVCMVPEKREEITTEGGLDAVFHEKELAPTMARMADNGIQVSLFIDPELAQVDAAARLGAPMVELHTGCFANHAGKERTAGAGPFETRRGAGPLPGHPGECRPWHQLPESGTADGRRALPAMS